MFVFFEETVAGFLSDKRSIRNTGFQKLDNICF